MNSIHSQKQNPDLIFHSSNPISKNQYIGPLTKPKDFDNYILDNPCSSTLRKSGVLGCDHVQMVKDDDDILSRFIDRNAVQKSKIDS